MPEFLFLRAAAACLAILLLQGCTHETAKNIIDPAYRPPSENSAEFITALKTTTIAVYPSIVRTPEETSYSVKSQQQIVSLLNEKKMTTAVAKPGAIDPGELKGKSQWDMFSNDLHQLAAELKSQKPAAQYNLVMEFLLPPGNQAIFGIHCYVFDRHGENAFSFLLNSHHRLFVDAGLSAGDSSAASRAKLIEKATKAGVTALIQQVNAPDPQQSASHEGYSITTQKISPFDKKVERIFVITRLQKSLIPVFMHSFKHSLVSAFESNGVDVAFKFATGESGALEEFENEIDTFAPDATMLINLDPLHRTHRDGHEAIVGTDFEVNLINRATGSKVWHATGKVDYIANFFFKRHGYKAHEGIRKEFAWHTSAAIVRAFMVDINGRKSEPIYTVTEDRQLYGQRTD